MICDGCLKDKPDVKTVIDPYSKEINDHEIEVDLCDDCYTAHCDDI